MFLICDLETTSNNVNNAEVLTGSFLAVDSELNLIDEMRIKCKPVKWNHEAEAASAIHGITKEMTKDWQSFEQVIPDLFGFFEKYDLKHFVCHAKRDMFGKQTTYDHAVMRLNLFTTDYYWNFVNKFRERNIVSTHSLALYLSSRYDFEGRDLKSLCRSLGIKLEQHHDDRHDAMACYEILKVFMPQIKLNEFLIWDNFKEVLNENAKKTGRGNRAKPK